MRQRTSNNPVLPPSRWMPSVWSGVAGNLALDEALLDEAHDVGLETPLVRLWEPDEYAVVIGSSSRLSNEVHGDACRSHGIRILRRPSGGATVVVGPGCLMWSIVQTFTGGMPGLDAIHAGCLDPIVQALARRGYPVRRAGTSDIVLDDRKVAGNALRVRRKAVLYHGTFLDAFDIELIDRVLPHPPREPDYRARRPHTAFLTNLAIGRELFEDALREAFAVSGVASSIPDERARSLLESRYLNPDWVGRL